MIEEFSFIDGESIESAAGLRGSLLSLFNRLRRFHRQPGVRVGHQSEPNQGVRQRASLSSPGNQEARSETQRVIRRGQRDFVRPYPMVNVFQLLQQRHRESLQSDPSLAKAMPNRKRQAWCALVVVPTTQPRRVVNTWRPIEVHTHATPDFVRAEGVMNESLLWLLRDVRKARKGGPTAITRRQRERLAQMIAHARAHSPYYRDAYRHLPDRIDDPATLSVTSKKLLMGRFNDWVTDREVTTENVRTFMSSTDRIGDPFLGKYRVATTSGTTGTPGIFLIDERSFAVTSALVMRVLGAWLNGGDVIRIVMRGGRMSMVMATGGHFASTVAAARMRKGSRRRAKAIQVLSAQMALPELVARLNEFRPALLAPYASVAALLASEQEAGRLHINPVLLTLSAEGLPPREYDRIAKAFNAKVGNSYAATECPFLSFSCEHKWLHVNEDWVVVEPVDAEYRPTPAGTQSHTVLISNLANHVQPVLRYDLGDSILQRPDPCPCGNPLTAIRVQGRAADVVTFPTTDGQHVSIPPLALEVDDIGGVELLQIVQASPTTLRVRLRTAAGADPDTTWRAVHAEITRVLGQHNLAHVVVERAEEPPEQSAGGKYRAVIPLPSASR